MPLSLIVQNSQQLEETSEGVSRKMDAVKELGGPGKGEIRY